MIRVDVRSRTPIYEQIIKNIKSNIISGVLEADEKLPSVRELAGDLTINPNTIQKAYKALEREGYIYSVPGRGNYVMKLDKTLIEEEKNIILEKLKGLVWRLYELGMTKDDLINKIQELGGEGND